MNNKKLTNARTKLDFLTTAGRGTKTTIFGVLGAILIATIGISAISSAAPAEAARQGFTENSRSHSSCSSGEGGCTLTAGGTFDNDGFHSNHNCNNKRFENTGENQCRFNQFSH